MKTLKSSLRLLRYLLCSFVMLCGAMLPVTEGLCVTSSITNPDIEKALLLQDWRTVNDTSGPAEKLVELPVLRAIKGHACLLLNRNNDSLNLFLSLANKADRESWKSWSQAFAQKNATSPVAHYLEGDALARLDEFDAASVSFNKSIGLAKQMGSNFYPALNALGAVYSARRQWNMAETCFKEAIAINQDFADAHANAGTMFLYRKRLRDAAAAYDQAASKSSNFALSLNGRGCINFLEGPKNWEKAKNDFAQAGKQMGLPVIAFSAELMNQAVFDASSKANLYLRDPKEIVDWNDMQKVIRDRSSLLGRYFQAVDLTRENPKIVIDRLNEIMDEPRLYDDNREAIEKLLQKSTDLALLSGINNLISDTTELRLKQVSEMNVYEKGAIRGLNRGLMNLCYPKLIGEAGKTKAGMSLTLNGGIAVDGYSYKQGLSTSSLLSAKDRMEYTYRPIATALQQVPIIGFLGQMWNQHLDASLGQTNSILQQRAVSPNLAQTGGLSTEELMALFFRRDAWKPMNWYGLVYNISPEES